MAFSDHKIAAFAHKITDLPDQPNLPADELKARFDSSPEELRVAHNALCDDADRLDDRVSGIIAETFGDAIPKSMLADELQDEIDAKASQTALAAVSDDVTAEAAARESADTALDTRVDALETELPQKVEIYVGTYSGTGDSNTQRITLPFTPKAVLVSPNSNSKARLILPNNKAQQDNTYFTGHLEGNVLVVYGSLNITNNWPHNYIAFV